MNGTCRNWSCCWALSVALVVLLLHGCQKPGPGGDRGKERGAAGTIGTLDPWWVTREETSKESMFFTGIGRGKDRARARDQAQVNAEEQVQKYLGTFVAYEYERVQKETRASEPQMREFNDALRSVHKQSARGWFAGGVRARIFEKPDRGEVEAYVQFRLPKKLLRRVIRQAAEKHRLESGNQALRKQYEERVKRMESAFED